jgi:TrmH family RNA methyltransferase
LPAAVQYDNLRVVMVEPRNPLNMGAAARAMSNFGFLHLRVVNPFNIAFRDARSAVGATAVLKKAKEFGSVAEAVADCELVIGTTAVRDRALHQPLRGLEAGAKLIRKHLATGKVALMFGTEKYGLSNLDLSHCHWLMRIPTRDEHISMNLGHAVAVCLYELSRGTRSVVKPGKNEMAKAKEVERITRLMFDVLLESGYIKPRAASAEEKLRRLVRRLKLNMRDAAVLSGMLRQIDWKLRSGEPRGATKN